MRVLIIEDERELAETLKQGLEQFGLAVDLAFDGADGEFKSTLTDYDVIVLDLNLPDMDGLDICRAIRDSGGSSAILMLTARARVSERVRGLNAGADDYMVKPFAFEELLARIMALLRRSVSGRRPVLRVGRLEVDPGRMRAVFDGTTLPLTAREFQLLYYLARRSPDIISQEELLEHVWDEQMDPMTHTVRVHVANIRRKLREAAGENLIETVIGGGYRLCGPREDCPEG